MKKHKKGRKKSFVGYVPKDYNKFFGKLTCPFIHAVTKPTEYWCAKVRITIEELD